MIKRFRADIAYEVNEEGEAPALDDLVEEARKRIGAAVVINEGQLNEARGYFKVEDCHHDEPNGPDRPPCVVTEKWEVGRGKVI